MKGLAILVSKWVVILGAMMLGSYSYLLETEIKASEGAYLNGPVRLRCLRPGMSLTVMDGREFLPVWDLPARPRSNVKIRGSR